MGLYTLFSLLSLSKISFYTTWLCPGVSHSSHSPSRITVAVFFALGFFITTGLFPNNKWQNSTNYGTIISHLTFVKIYLNFYYKKEFKINFHNATSPNIKSEDMFKLGEMKNYIGQMNLIKLCGWEDRSCEIIINSSVWICSCKFSSHIFKKFDHIYQFFILFYK